MNLQQQDFKMVKFTDVLNFSEGEGSVINIGVLEAIHVSLILIVSNLQETHAY